MFFGMFVLYTKEKEEEKTFPLKTTATAKWSCTVSLSLLHTTSSPILAFHESLQPSC